MLARFQFVDPQTSEYKRRGSQALVYGGMTFLRVGIAADAATTLARAVTIAIRYAAIRQQFADETRHPRLNKQVFSTTAWCSIVFSLSSAQRTGFSLLPKACAVSMSHGTTISVEGIETARRACGGHGYSHYSGIGHLYSEMLPSVTYEGDNYMLTKQVARALIKGAKAKSAMFADYNPSAKFDFAKDVDIIKAYGHRVAFQTFQIIRLRDTGSTWNALLIPFWRLCTAYAQFIICSSRRPLPPTRPYDVDNYASEFADAQAVPAALRDGVSRQKAIADLLSKIRPHAVNLMDGWAFSDLVLNSSLGRSDGKAYESMFRRAAANPVNTLTFDPVRNRVCSSRADRRWQSCKRPYLLKTSDMKGLSDCQMAMRVTCQYDNV
ncbi:fatty-acyl coenzyme A oxidase [Apiotrichum porosum]|uniref:Fatty-acyl coenzyme A oxidase n=1 Tax=Apiotrichum porosum TaxID=105984 RepID=A0A427XCA7_9TREE|nr:fatty-acyl coenzyme A oxidase [Apiotrichum porosum]RSH76520.1 fatty-acyl coenzyme A oxidase [Apiotrichum porosum]